MTQQIPYEQIRNRPCDFIVKYRFLTKEEGGRKAGLPYQGIQSDFMYDGDEPEKDGIFMIHPEFLDKNNNVIKETIRVPEKGKANMWILNPGLIEYHRKRIKIGTKGYFMEGPNITGECEVIEIIGLNNEL